MRKGILVLFFLTNVLILPAEEEKSHFGLSMQKIQENQNAEEQLSLPLNPSGVENNKREWDFDKYENDWPNLVDKACSNYKSLTRPERVWYNIESLIALVGNGGFICFYHSNNGDHIFDVIDDLVLIGADDIAEILRKINSFFPNGIPPKNYHRRYFFMDKCGEKCWSYEIDEELYKKEAMLENLLFKYLEENL